MIPRKKDLISMNLERPCSPFCKHFGLLKQTRENRLIEPLIVQGYCLQVSCFRDNNS